MTEMAASAKQVQKEASMQPPEIATLECASV